MLIANDIEESLTLEYKSAGTLTNTKRTKKEITKDVSAMANAVGGVLIYGIAEDPQDRHLPGKIDPLDRKTVSKEWLEQVITQIRPRIEGIEIYPITISSSLNDVVYAVVIPQCTTAHQAADLRYYKRFNFEAVPMEDYEIRDVMNRRSDPKIELLFEFSIVTVESFLHYKSPTHKDCQVIVHAKNIGLVYALYVNAFLEIPTVVLHDPEVGGDEDPGEFATFLFENTMRDVVDFGTLNPKYGPSRFDPILPSLSLRIGTFRLVDDFESNKELRDKGIRWTVHADNASARSGTVGLCDLVM